MSAIFSHPFTIGVHKEFSWSRH